jgi:hypothetical protein
MAIILHRSHKLTAHSRKRFQSASRIYYYEDLTEPFLSLVSSCPKWTATTLSYGSATAVSRSLGVGDDTRTLLLRLSDQLLRRHNRISRNRSPRPASLCDVPRNRRFIVDGDWPSNSRSRSICFWRLADGSDSSLRCARSRSPISCAIARLWVWSMSIRFRITEPSFR